MHPPDHPVVVFEHDHDWFLVDSSTHWDTNGTKGWYWITAYWVCPCGEAKRTKGKTGD